MAAEGASRYVDLHYLLRRRNYDVSLSDARSERDSYIALRPWLRRSGPAAASHIQSHLEYIHTEYGAHSKEDHNVDCSVCCHLHLLNSSEYRFTD